MKFKTQNNLRLLRATKNTFDGIKTLWHREQAFRQEIYLTIILIPIIFFINISSILKLLLGLLILLLLVVETLNSALETIVDRISIEPHPQSKIAKDMGSTAVGIVIIMNVIAWIYAIYHSLLYVSL